MIAIKGLIMTELDTRTAVSKYLPIPKGKLPYHWRGPQKVDQKIQQPMTFIPEHPGHSLITLFWKLHHV